MWNICGLLTLMVFAGGCASPALYGPAQQGDISAASALISAGSDPNEIGSYQDNHETALHVAVGNSRLEMARFLIAHGANLNAEAYNQMQGTHDGTPLHYAACIGNAGMVQLLLESGANPEPGTGACRHSGTFASDGETPLALAEKHGNQMAATLIRTAISNKLGLTSGGSKNADEYGPIVTALLKSYQGAGKTIAVAGFSHADNRVSTDGNIISERFTTELINHRTLKVVERKEIEKVLGELKLQNTGTIDSESAKKMGRMLGADLLVIGGIVELPGQVLELNIRLASVESGEAVAAVTGRVIKDWVN